MSEPWKTYLFSYRYLNDSYVMEVKGESPGDARRRLACAAIGAYDGELIEKAHVWVAPWIPIEVWFRNLFRRSRDE